MNHRLTADHQTLSEAAPVRGRKRQCVVMKMSHRVESASINEMETFQLSMSTITYISDRLPGGLYFSIPSKAHILFTVCSGISSRISIACCQ